MINFSLRKFSFSFFPHKPFFTKNFIIRFTILNNLKKFNYSQIMLSNEKDQKSKPNGLEEKEKINIETEKKTQKPTNKKKEKKEEDETTKKGTIGVKVVKGARDFLPFQMSIRKKAFDLITEVFKKHGAVEIDTPVFELKETLMGKYGEESKLIYDLQDQGGELLSLRYDLTVPFARYMAVHNFPSIKRYHIGKVYRRDTPQMSKGRYREFYQCDFDIAGPNYGKMIPDSEVLKVVVDILTKLPIGKFLIKLNHRKILDATIHLSGIPDSIFKQVCSSVDKLDKESWEVVRDELIKKGVSETQADKLWTFVQLKGSPWQMYEKLASDQEMISNQNGKEALEEMKILFEYLDILQITEYMSFDLSLARGLDYYTGLIYEAVLTDTDKVGSICGGGRYDNLLGMFSSKVIPAVGVTIGIERIFNILEDNLKDDPSIRPIDTEVLVVAIGKNLTKERFKLVNELWSKGIKVN
jgi:histidyl-tRNA synthetase